MSRSNSPAPVLKKSHSRSSSLQDLFHSDIFEERDSFDEGESISTFEEVPGAWSGDDLDDDEETPSQFELLSEKSRKNFVIAFIFSILTLFGTLFLIASLLNGGLPRYGVEEAEKIIVYYDEYDKFSGELKRDGNWKYYRFQSHNEVENITAKVSVTTTNETIIPPLAVYIRPNMVPSEALDINGTSILEGTLKPDNEELDLLLKANLIVCGPRTVYIGITLPYWTPATSSLDAIHFELTIFRTVPDSYDGLCETERFRAFLLVFILQPISVWICTSLCFVFLSLGLFYKYRLKKITIIGYHHENVA